MLKRRKRIEEEIILSGKAPADGMPRGGLKSDETARKAERIIARQAENERRIQAVEKAWIDCHSDAEREFVKKNLFENMQMWQIYILLPETGMPMSERTMKRYRKKFLIRLAENLYEI